MSRVRNPLLFSKHFGVDPARLAEAKLIDPFVNVDTPLFVDPVLLEKSSIPLIKMEGLKAFRAHFSNFIRLLAISKAERDSAWRAAERLLDLHEALENGLGYGGGGRAGSSRPDAVRNSIMRTSKEIIDLGASDPEMISLMGFFEENVGPDTISDFTSRVIIEQLTILTEEFCVRHGVPMEIVPDRPGHTLPVYVNEFGKRIQIVLVPEDIVRELPDANSWEEIERAALQNRLIRDRVNAFLASIAKPTVAKRKEALRAAAMSSAENFELFLETVKEHTKFYDTNIDALGYYRLKQIISSNIDKLKAEKRYDISIGPDELKSLVIDTIMLFKHHVEKGNLWEELWLGDKPKKERAAQLIYFAIADCFCRANNVDISPEANMGGGPIDFKFSVGYSARVLVELKRSSGTVKHGYETQLEIYKDASCTQMGIFVIMDYGNLNQKLNIIRKIQQNRLASGQSASDIIVINARKKISASKRR